MKNQRSMFKLKNAAIFTISIVALFSCKKKEDVSKYENTSWKVTYVDQTDHVIASDSMETMTYTDTTINLNSNVDTNLAKSIGIQFDFQSGGKGVVTFDGKTENITWKDVNGNLTFSLPVLVGDSMFKANFNVSQDISVNPVSEKVINWVLKLKGNTMMGTTMRYRVKREDVLTYKLEKM